MGAIRIRVSETGRLSLPIELRRALGIERGGDVLVEWTGHEVRIRTLDDVIADIQSRFRKHLEGKPPLTVDDFIAERRADWGEE